MGRGPGYRIRPFGGNRRLVAASTAVGRERNTIHVAIEVDVTDARRIIARHRERTGERLSFTGYVVACLARACAERPEFNAFRKGRRLVLLDEVTVNVLYEREVGGERVPDAVGIRAADRKTYREISDDIREEQKRSASSPGVASGMGWIRFVPEFLLKSVIRLASKSIRIQQRFGVVAVTSVGMFGSGAMWLYPLSSATVVAAVGSIVKRVGMIEGRAQEREHLCVTLSFDHDIVDGAPAARFARRFADITSGAAILQELTDGHGSEGQGNPADAGVSARMALKGDHS